MHVAKSDFPSNNSFFQTAKLIQHKHNWTQLDRDLTDLDVHPRIGMSFFWGGGQATRSFRAGAEGFGCLERGFDVARQDGQFDQPNFEKP